MGTGASELCIGAMLSQAPPEPGIRGPTGAGFYQLHAKPAEVNTQAGERGSVVSQHGRKECTMRVAKNTTLCRVNRSEFTAHLGKRGRIQNR